ncbi:hypothetical protein ACFW2Y_24115 [Streptomyces sp. NPDC058877]|uniref:hypothetical protein n=1 Tax=unclassified Streptomyces TaxID=2593676 RepID=UPI0036CEA6C3
MPEQVDGEERGTSRRSVLRMTGALLAGLALGAGGAAQAVGAPAPAPGVRGSFGAPGYAWRATGARARSGATAAGVVFTLVSHHGRPLPGRRVRFSLSAFRTARPSIWLGVSQGLKSAVPHGYLDLDTGTDGTLVLDPWLRHGAVPTAAVGTRPVLRAQLVGSEAILASAHLGVLSAP